jgi:hypothetical protein
MSRRVKFMAKTDYFFLGAGWAKELILQLVDTAISVNNKVGCCNLLVRTKFDPSKVKGGIY